MNNIANLYVPVKNALTGNAPLVIRTVITKQANMMSAGVPAQTQVIEDYVLLSALPLELRSKVELMIQALASSI